MKLHKDAASTAAVHGVPVGGGRTSWRVLTVVDILSAIRKEAPSILAGLSQSNAIQLVKSVLDQVRARVNNTTEGDIRVASLGCFKIRRLGSANANQPGPARHVSFNPVANDPGKTVAPRTEMLKTLVTALVVEIREKPLSDFTRVDDVRTLLATDRDSLLVCRRAKSEKRHKRIYLNDLETDDPYLLKLTCAKLVPSQFIRGGIEAKDAALPSGLRRHHSADLLLSKDDEVVADSFPRYRFCPETLAYNRNDGWTGVLPSQFVEIDDPCLFVDLVCGHFGHALVDTPARLWPLNEEMASLLKDLKFVGFGMHGVDHDQSRWPQWLKVLLDAYGIEPISRLVIADTPMRCRSLIIPKRVSPYLSGSGAEYDGVMRTAGDRLVEATVQRARSTRRKVFLSRSRLKNKRTLGSEQEEQLDVMFESMGYEVIHPQEMTLSEQVSVVRGATHIVGCVGSQMHLSAFCDIPPKVLRITPSFFPPDTDHRIVSEKGGTVTDFIVERDLPPAVKVSRADWNLGERDLAALPAFVKKWEE